MAVLIMIIVCLSQQIFATLEVCPNITVFWWPHKPYIFSKATVPGGSLPTLLQESVKNCCKNQPHIDWSNNLLNYEAALLSVLAPPAHNTVTNNNSVEIWLPFSLLRLPNRSRKTNVPILNTQHLVIFTKESHSDYYKGLLRISPLIMVMLFSMILFGIFIWLAETKTNTTEFPPPFYKGAWHGFWWAIVTVTTVGYGDKSPRTVIGRCIGILWMTIGLVLLPVLTAELTSVLTDTSYTLMLKNVVALKHSRAIKSASDNGALVKECTSNAHCVEMVNSGIADAMVVDPHVARHVKETYTQLTLKTAIPASIAVDVIFHLSQSKQIYPLLNCIRRNSSLVTNSLIGSQDTDSKATDNLLTSGYSIFSTTSQLVVGILVGVVIFIYFVTLIYDRSMTNMKIRNVEEFREGAFTGKCVLENELQKVDVSITKKKTMELIQIQKKQLRNMFAALEEMERRCRSDDYSSL